MTTENDWDGSEIIDPLCQEDMYDDLAHDLGQNYDAARECIAKVVKENSGLTFDETFGGVNHLSINRAHRLVLNVIDNDPRRCENFNNMDWMEFFEDAVLNCDALVKDTDGNIVVDSDIYHTQCNKFVVSFPTPSEKEQAERIIKERYPKFRNREDKVVHKKAVRSGHNSFIEWDDVR